MNVQSDAPSIAQTIAAGDARAADVVASAIQRIETTHARLNAFTRITAERAIAAAESVDARRACGETLPPLAGVPYAVKNLFDIARETTLAGAAINRENAPATADATAIQRLDAAGAILVGALNMDEYAYGFTTENTHFGATENPHDVTRIAGGSSGGSAAAVAAGLVPISLGTDTNGSIRVPASLCGVFGLKPTYGRLSRAGTFPFAASFDTIGPFARSVADLAAAYDAMQGADPRDPVCAPRATQPVSLVLNAGVSGLRIARLAGYFDRYLGEQSRAAIEAVCSALRAERSVVVPNVERARAAAMIITACEGSNVHRENLLKRAADFEPITRDRLVAGLMIPADWYVRAQRLRRWFQGEVAAVFAQADLLVAGATPFPAHAIGTEWVEVGGERMPARPACGLLTQPISFIGLPVVSVPIQVDGALPIGVQLIAPPWREDLAFRAAALLEREGVVRAPIARAFR